MALEWRKSVSQTSGSVQSLSATPVFWECRTLWLNMETPAGAHRRALAVCTCRFVEMKFCSSSPEAIKGSLGFQGFYKFSESTLVPFGRKKNSMGIFWSRLWNVKPDLIPKGHCAGLLEGTFHLMLRSYRRQWTAVELGLHCWQFAVPAVCPPSYCLFCTREFWNETTWQLFLPAPPPKKKHFSGNNIYISCGFPSKKSVWNK